MIITATILKGPFHAASAGHPKYFAFPLQLVFESADCGGSFTISIASILTLVIETS